MEPAVSPAQTHDPTALGRAWRGGKDLVTHEDVLAGPPGGVGPPNEAGTADRFDLAIQRVQIVLVLRHQLRVLRAALLDPVADVEDHQAFIPVAQIGQAILHVDVVEEVAGLVRAGLPARHLAAACRDRGCR